MRSGESREGGGGRDKRGNDRGNDRGEEKERRGEEKRMGVKGTVETSGE
jgi:hypothetical protein